MMGQAIEEGKGFLRIRLDADGALTIYPVLTEELVRDYDITPQPVMTSSGRTTRIPVPSGPLRCRGSSSSRSGAPDPAPGPAGPPPGVGPVGPSETVEEETLG